ncbi:response regulator transcription factor [Erysipelotrichaceae bacterium OttesenSCG-928-M19]|nr:response regulator transcription factor [Erysipelotrichaceae bacterium OttesenSCG-928-M19]
MEKILVIEDESALQLLLEFDLKSSNYEVELCGDGLVGLQLLQDNYYDLALVDWMLPSLSGYEIIKEIRKTNQDLKIIMLTAKDSEMDIVKGLDVGADDYLTKPFSSRELNSRIKAQFRRKHLKSYYIDDIEVNLAKRAVTKQNEIINLTKIEFDLLVYFIENKNIVISRDTINEKIWGFDNDIDLRVIDAHISSIKKKLDLKQRLIAKRGVGYVFVDEG